MMKTIAVAVLTLAAAGLCDAQTFRFVDRIQWRAQETVVMRRWTIADKPAHFLFGLSMQTTLASMPGPWQKHSWRYNVAFAFLYEVKDGMIKWSPENGSGGDGFDYADFAANVIGATYERGRRKLPPAVRLLIIPLEVWAITALFNKWDGKL